MVFERDGKSVSVLEDINLEVSDGEFICLVGPSGCGKSTLLNVMGGFLSPTSGSVTIDGEVVHGPDPRRILVFQERGVFPWLTVEGNIGFGLSKLSRAERERTHRTLRSNGASAGFRADLSFGPLRRHEAAAAGGSRFGGQPRHPLSGRAVRSARFDHATHHARRTASYLADASAEPSSS